MNRTMTIQDDRYTNCVQHQQVTTESKDYNDERGVDTASRPSLVLNFNFSLNLCNLFIKLNSDFLMQKQSPINTKFLNT